MCIHPTFVEALLLEDFKHHQLLHHMESLGFEPHGLQAAHLSTIIYNLMQVPEAQRNTWVAQYASFLEEATGTTSLAPLARRCYQALRQLAPVAPVG
jgi:hypothetical protein